MEDNEKIIDKSLEPQEQKMTEAEMEAQTESLADQVKIVSPGAMVLKRFLRSRLSIVGLVMLICLFAFSFLGPIFISWGEIEIDYSPGKEIITENIASYYEQYDVETYKNYAYEKVGSAINGGKSCEIRKFTDIKDSDGNDIYYFVVKSGSAESYYRCNVDLDESGKAIVVDGVVQGAEQVAYDLIEVTTFRRNINMLADPSWKHILGTDKQGMDIFVRLMYGGRVSLTLGFVVVILETIFGVILGGLAGYFGGWVDQIIMRLVDILNCLPGLPIMLIVSAIVDGMNVPGNLRIYFLMGIMTLLGWSGIARMVRGQILYLREQEFMVAADALGLSVPRKIFRHLVPNVMPQLIVQMTLGLGGIILSESTLSYLGLGIPIPYAAWGTMIATANDPNILEFYWNLWVPPGILIVLAVLGFNFVGDGLRDAFDPKGRR